MGVVIVCPKRSLRTARNRQSSTGTLQRTADGKSGSCGIPPAFFLVHPAESRAGRAGGGATNVDMGIQRLFASAADGMRRTAKNGTRIPGKREPFRIVAERRNGLGKTEGRSGWPAMLQLDRYVRFLRNGRGIP